jgi:hypothetical protein
MTLFQPVLDAKHTPYCGPAAVAILTGVPLTRVEKMLKRGRKGWGSKAIKGTYTWEIKKVLKRLGCKIEDMKNPENTICKFADDVRHAGTYLVQVTGHYMVACAGVIADNGNPQGIPLEMYGRGGRRVRRAWRVIAPTLPKFTVDDALTTSKPAKPKKDLKTVRAAKVAADIKRWERKEKLAKTKLKKLRAKQKYYQRQNVVAPWHTLGKHHQSRTTTKHAYPV